MALTFISEHLSTLGHRPDTFLNLTLSDLEGYFAISGHLHTERIKSERENNCCKQTVEAPVRPETVIGSVPACS